MRDYIAVLMLAYFFCLIVNMVAGRLFLREFKKQYYELWVEWGSPSSVFSPKNRNLDIYKFIFSIGKHRPKTGELKFKSRFFAVSTVFTQVTFVLTVFVFVINGIRLNLL